MSKAESFAPDQFKIALHQIGRGDIVFSRDATVQGEWVTARFHLDRESIPGATYYDAVSLYSCKNEQLEIIALEKRRTIGAADEACVRVRIGD